MNCDNLKNKRKLSKHTIIGLTTAVLVGIIFFPYHEGNAQIANSHARMKPSALASDEPVGEAEIVATFSGAMPTGVTVAENGRIFVNFPHWGDHVLYSVGELLGNNKVVPYPNIEINKVNEDHPERSFVSVQSVVADGHGKLWVLDTGAPNFSKPIPNGAKLVAVDLKTNKVVKTIILKDNVVLPTTYVNDVRFDYRVGKGGVAYITDSSLSGPGGIIVVDLASGRATRRLSGDKSTSPEKDFVPFVEGRVLLQRKPDGSTTPFNVASDGIALSADGQTLYFCPLSSRHLYSIPTSMLRNTNINEAELSAAVKDLGEKGASDGLAADATNQIYAGDYENNSIRKMDTQGRWKTIIHAPYVLWPDTLSISRDGYLYFTVNQLHRQAGFHMGHDLRQKPYALLRIKIGQAPANSY